jgi:hypothetical protein
MTYRRFKLPEGLGTLSTIATPATFSGALRSSVATVATVATGDSRSSRPNRSKLSQTSQVSQVGKDKASIFRIHCEPDELEERKGLAMGAVPELYLDAWARLQLQRPYAMPEDRWRQAIDEAGRFLDQWGSSAIAQSWTASDLFDVPGEGKPGGLVWSLQGEAVRALGPDHAVTQADRVFDRLENNQKKRADEH